MNSLSWMIYAAEVLGRLSEAGVGVTIFGGIFALVAVPGTLIAERDGDLDPDLGRKIRRFWVVPLVGFIVAILAPSQQAIYMIAASEAGETVISTPEAREVFNDLKTIIKGKLKEQLPTP